MRKRRVLPVSYTHLVYVEGRPKTDSKSLLYSIDALHEACLLYTSRCV